MKITKQKLKQLIKEELQKHLKEFDIPQSPTDKGREMGQDPTGEETSTLGLEEADKGPGRTIQLDIIGSIIHQSGLMNAGEALEQMGFRADFVTSPLPMWMLEKDGVKYAALNKKYVEDPDLIVGDIAIGVMG